MRLAFLRAKHHAGLPPLPGAVGAAIVGENPAAGDPLAVEPRHSTHQETHGHGLLLVRQHLDVGHAGGVIHGHMGLLVACTRRADLVAITGDAVANSPKAGQLFGVDMDHVAELSQLVPANRILELQASQANEPDALEPTANGRERRYQVVGDATHGATLMA